MQCINSAPRVPLRINRPDRVFHIEWIDGKLCSEASTFDRLSRFPGLQINARRSFSYRSTMDLAPCSLITVTGSLGIYTQIPFSPLHRDALRMLI